MELNWIEVDKFFHYARFYQGVTTIFSFDGNTWFWDIIHPSCEESGAKFTLTDAKKEVDDHKSFFE